MDYSQFAEAKILDGFISILNLNKDSYCVEFGAWDGQHLSNTFHLIEQQNWNALLIEGDKKKFKTLQANMAAFNRVQVKNSWVSFEGQSTLDSLLKEAQIPREFELLSIDIDGNDYHVWDALRHFKPKLVVIEFNPSIPADINFIQPKDMSIQQGSSIKAIVELAEKKGYSLAAVTGCNAIFVLDDLFNQLGIPDNSIASLWKEAAQAPRVFQLYDGTIVTEPFSLYWRKLDVHPMDLQVLPANQRKFGKNPPLLKRIINKLTN